MGAGVEHQLKPAEEAGAQRRVVLEIRQEHLEALGHVDIEGGGDLAQVAHRFADLGCRRPAVVDVQRAAVPQDQADVVVAAGGVVPGQPVDHDRWLVLQECQHGRDHRLIAAQHALGVDHRLGHAGGAGGEQELGDSVGADPGRGRLDPARGRGCEQIGKGRRSSPGRRIGRHRDLGRGRHGGLDRSFICGPGGGEDQAGPDELDDLAQLAEVVGDQRVGGRDRSVGNPDVLRGERQQRMLEIVAREDRERALGRKPALEQRLADPAHALEGFGVGQPPPGAIRTALGQKRARGRVLGPALQPLGQARRIVSERVRRAGADRAIGAMLQLQIERAQTDLA